MVHKEVWGELANKTRLYGQLWCPDDYPSAIICLVHGLGEHSGRYASLAAKLTMKNIALVCYDLPGHGQSSGKRGDGTYQTYSESITFSINYAKATFPTIPVFLYGHSMGGNLALNFMLDNNNDTLTGLICTSPWLKLAHEPHHILKTIVGLLSIFVPHATISNGLKPEYISRDIDQVKNYVTDPLIHNRISFKLFNQIERSALKARTSIYKINLPFLLMHGEADQITSHEASKEFVMNASSRTTFKLWPGAYHELHHETNHDEIISFTIKWIENLLVTVEKKALVNGYF